MNELAMNVREELLELQDMKLAQLKQKWLALYGTEAPNFGIQFLRRRLAYRIQELAYGGVTEPTLKKIREVNVPPTRGYRKKLNLRAGMGREPLDKRLLREHGERIRKRGRNQAIHREPRGV